MTIDASLTPFFAPKGVAIIGASANPAKLGYGLARNLKESHYAGAIHFVNPKGGTLFGQPIHTVIADIPDPVDLAMILVPAQYMPATLRACGQRGIPAAILGAGGFREVGQAGADLEAECVAIAKEYGMRLLGPNCVGMVDTHLPVNITFLPPPGPLPGDVALLSHSGAICAAAIDWSRGQGYGLSRLVSLGNQADVSETDLLVPTLADPFTKVITLYLESVRSGRRFVTEAQKVTPHKPVIALKVGRYEAGQRAAASHTGALAGQESAYDAAFRRAGVLRATTTEEMLDKARVLAWCPLPKGRRVAVLTNAGGPGVIAADALEALGLELAAFAPETGVQLDKILSEVASTRNPVDMVAGAGPVEFAACLQILLADSNVDSVLVIYPTPPMFTAGAVAKALIPIIHAAEKPVILAVMGERLIQEAVTHLQAASIPEYRFPERAAAALAALTERAELLAFAQAQEITFDDVDFEVVAEILAKSDPGFLPPEINFALLAAYGIPTLTMELAVDGDQAAALAEQIGYPVVLKVASADIPHKSDVGGVALNLKDAPAVRAAFDTMMPRVRQAHPDAQIEGVHVQQMVSGGQEVIVGAVQDPQFGALAMFGSGGVEVEGLKDVAFALAPVTAPETEAMLAATWAGKKLKGFRNLPPADREAVQTVIARLAQLTADHPQIAEIEINPLRVLEVGKGALAVDVRIRKAA